MNNEYLSRQTRKFIETIFPTHHANKEQIGDCEDSLRGR